MWEHYRAALLWFWIHCLLCAGAVISIHLHPTLFRTFALMLDLDDNWAYSGECELSTDGAVKRKVSAQWSLNKACLNLFVSKIPCKGLHSFECHATVSNVNICCNSSVQLYAAGCLRLGWMLHTEHNLFSDRKMFQVAEHEVRSNVWVH